MRERTIARHRRTTREKHPGLRREAGLRVSRRGRTLSGVPPRRLFSFPHASPGPRKTTMKNRPLTMAEQVAQAASDFQLERTGHKPTAVTVVLSEETLVVTLHEALSPAEQILARTAEGAATIQEYHRQLFKSSEAALLEEI